MLHLFTMSSVHAVRRVSGGGLGELDVEQFMALSSSGDEMKVSGAEEAPRKGRCSKRRKRLRAKLKRCSAIAKRRRTEQEKDFELPDLPQEESSQEEEEEMGVVEQRPPEITSWKQKVSCLSPLKVKVTGVPSSSMELVYIYVCVAHTTCYSEGEESAVCSGPEGHLPRTVMVGGIGRTEAMRQPPPGLVANKHAEAYDVMPPQTASTFGHTLSQSTSLSLSACEEFFL